MFARCSRLLRRCLGPPRALARARLAGPAMVWRDHVTLTHRLYALGRLRNARHARASGSMTRPRDGVLTLMQGSVSLALGLVVAMTGVAGFARGPAAPWTESCAVLSGPFFGQPAATWKPPVVVAVVSVPTQFSALIALIGATLGLIGIVTRRRGRPVSALCALGVALCLGSFLLPLLNVLAWEWTT